jgi:hypothetical protein
MGNKWPALVRLRERTVELQEEHPMRYQYPFITGTTPMSQLDFSRVAVVGESGSGKAAFCRSLASALGQPHIDLETLAQHCGTSSAPEQAFFSSLKQTAASESWIIEGEHAACRTVSWPRVTLVIWVNAPLASILRQTLRRSLGQNLRRSIGQELTQQTRKKATVPAPSGRSALLSLVRSHAFRLEEYRTQRRTGLLTAAPWVELQSDPAAAELLNWTRFKASIETATPIQLQSAPISLTPPQDFGQARSSQLSPRVSA